MWILSIILWIFWVWYVSQGNGFKQDYHESVEDTEGDSVLGAVSSVDELLELLYPHYAMAQRCLQRRAQGTPSNIHSDEAGWENSREAALHRDDGTIQVIMAEIERTMCRPREVCLDVSKEYPESTSHFYVPRCVSVHRCGGCCNHEALHCSNTSHRLINKTLVELSPHQLERSVVMVTFVNHTACECHPKRPLHSIIRRATDTHHHALCVPQQVPCSLGLVWDPTDCQCVPQHVRFFSDTDLDPMDAALLALCGPNQALDEDPCGCACQNGLTEASCGLGRRLDEATCECVCEELLVSCPPSQRWDPEQCSCVCHADCPPGLRQHPETCQCQCQDSPRTCLLQGKRFNPQNCSCYRLPCRTPYRKCPSGSYYSHYLEKITLESK
ncbi:hypothetical protein JZ751_007030 [Albula glossodonta]|uniref:Platelet-derived growth factor (PDGF) family profile domain-containing protein n=1 Tax=Albula glossodonta TaxID=121402 RepID=A0A8T2P4T6_9TELE|nr:hypothetical protein JZ751_007030 [Albula glossodonta]